MKGNDRIDADVLKGVDHASIIPFLESQCPNDSMNDMLI
jgi:hypothetical protein